MRVCACALSFSGFEALGSHRWRSATSSGAPAEALERRGGDRAPVAGTRVIHCSVHLASAHHATRRVWLLGETAPAWRGLFAWAQMKQNAVHTPRNFVHFKLHSLISSHRGLSHAHSELDPAETPRAWHTRVTCCRALVPHAASVVRIVSRSPTQSLHVQPFFFRLPCAAFTCLPASRRRSRPARRARGSPCLRRLSSPHAKNLSHRQLKERREHEPLPVCHSLCGRCIDDLPRSL